MVVLTDTTEKARLVHEEVLRRKSPQQRLRMAQELTLGLQKIAFAAMRQRNPDLTDDEIWIQLAARRLGPDVVRKMYGALQAIRHRNSAPFTGAAGLCLSRSRRRRL